jgi:hypothetical protein
VQCAKALPFNHFRLIFIFSVPLDQVLPARLHLTNVLLHPIKAALVLEKSRYKRGSEEREPKIIQRSVTSTIMRDDAEQANLCREQTLPALIARSHMLKIGDNSCSNGTSTTSIDTAVAIQSSLPVDERWLSWN